MPSQREHRVPSQFAASLLRLADVGSTDAGQLLAGSGLEFDPGDPGATGWRPEISTRQYSRLYQSVLQSLQDETFGLHPAVGVPPGAFRMMCYSLIGCDNLGSAIRRAADFYRTFFPEQSALSLDAGGEIARLGYEGPDHGALCGAGARRVDVSDACSLSVWHRFFGWLTGRPLVLLRVDFRGTPPQRPDRYQKLFECPLHYGQDADRLHFDSALLSLPLVHTERSLDEFLRTAPYQLLTMTREQHENSLATQVKAMFGHDFRQGFPGFETISAALGISGPTLRRRLRQEGTSFQKLKDECRRDAACEYLRRADLSVNDVARQLGFTDPSAFHRSFKKWTGQTPGDYRRRDPA